MFYFPLLLTACWNSGVNLLRWVRHRPLPQHYPLTRRQLGLALAVTVALYAPLKLSPLVAAGVTEVVSWLSDRPRRPIVDPTDLLALLVLPLVWLHGRRFIEAPSSSAGRREAGTPAEGGR